MKDTRTGSEWSDATTLVGGENSFGCGCNPFIVAASVALSVDGTTALIGDQGDAPTPSGGVGAAWVFTRSGSTWIQDGPKLTAKEEVGSGEFGHAVAISSDGSRAVIGGDRDNGQVGAGWEFAVARR
ncbi:MAG TPA: hypothetical protein VEJ23_02930 [Solirubrobacteraceae bacterium]|nr:hypothetical protein [Solirubrobacteraceae bacterium]